MLPIAADADLLWSPAGTGPIAVRNQIVTMHDIAPIDFPDGYSPTFRYWYGTLWRQLLPRVRAIITVSEFTKRRLVENFGLAAEAIHVTHLGVDHSHFYPRPESEVRAIRQKYALPARFVLFVGTLSARKNMRRMLEAWRQCRNSDSHLVLVGGLGATGLAGRELPDLPPRTIDLGRLPDADLPALFSAATLFVYPSVYEGFGLPPLEAMAAGTPCLVSNVAAIPEVTGSAARQVDPYDVPALARAFDELLADTQLLREMRDVGLKHAKRFNWDVTAARTLEILQHHAEHSDWALALRNVKERRAAN